MIRKVFLFLLSPLALLTPFSATAQDTAFHADIPVLNEESIAAGINHVYDGSWEYFVGGGVSAFDCNQDRMPDLYFAGGSNNAALFINMSHPSGELEFLAAEQSALSIDKVLGSYPIDIDNDGYLDIVALRVGENQIFRGGPNCEFTRANASWNFDGGTAWSTAFSATFEPGNKFPTLAVGNYIDRTAPGSPWGTCHDNELHRPRSRGVQAPGAVTDAGAEAVAQVDSQTTTDNRVSEPDYTDPLPLSPGYCALSLLFTDWNKSGTDALRITNDRHYYRGGQEQMWRMNSGRYPRLYGSSDGWEPLVIWGMGIAEADLNADGYPEYALTSMGDTKLQILDLQEAIDEGRPRYDDMAWTRGATAHRPYTGDDLKPSTGWHAQFEDVNNDSYLDLFIAKGNVARMNDFAAYDPDNLLMGSASGRFSEQGGAAGIALDRRGRGANVVDLNADGLLDLVVVNRRENISLFRHAGMASSNGPRLGGNWLKIELEQKGANRHAIGARLSIKSGNQVQSRIINVGAGHASGSAGFIHVGLGVAERATLRVQWPDGEWSAPYKLFANHHVLIERDQDTFSQWFPSAPSLSAQSE